MFPGVRSSLVFSGFVLKPPASGFQSYSYSSLKTSPFVQSCFGVGRTLQTNVTGICGESSQFLGHTRFAPAHGMCDFPVYTAQALGCSSGNSLKRALGCMHFPGLSRSGSGTPVVLRGADSVGPAFCALPRSEQLR